MQLSVTCENPKEYSHVRLLESPISEWRRAQWRGRRRFSGTSRKNAPSSSGLGHWWNDCVDKASTPGGDSASAKSPGPEEANNEGTTKGPKRFQEGYCGRAGEGAGQWKYGANFIRYWEVLATGRPKWVRCYLNEMDTSSQAKPEGYVVWRSTSFTHAAPSNTPPLTNGYLHSSRTVLIWSCPAILEWGSCETIELLERMASQRRFTSRALTP